LLRVGRDGNIRPILGDLPSFGDHHVNGPVIGPGGRLYFGIGTFTNSGVLGKTTIGMDGCSATSMRTMSLAVM
jgi:hypothetical protein